MMAFSKTTTTTKTLVIPPTIKEELHRKDQQQDNDDNNNNSIATPTELTLFTSFSPPPSERKMMTENYTRKRRRRLMPSSSSSLSSSSTTTTTTISSILLFPFSWRLVYLLLIIGCCHNCNYSYISKSTHIIKSSTKSECSNRKINSSLWSPTWLNQVRSYTGFRTNSILFIDAYYIPSTSTRNVAYSSRRRHIQQQQQQKHQHYLRNQRGIQLDQRIHNINYFHPSVSSSTSSTSLSSTLHHHHNHHRSRIVLSLSPSSSLSSSSSSLPNYGNDTVVDVTMGSSTLSRTVVPRPPDHGSDDLQQQQQQFHSQQQQEQLDDERVSLLQSKTVKELKDWIVQKGWNERGLWSRLKLKHDMIDFLISKMEQQQDVRGSDGSSIPPIDAVVGVVNVPPHHHHHYQEQQQQQQQQTKNKQIKQQQQQQQPQHEQVLQQQKGQQQQQRTQSATASSSTKSVSTIRARMPPKGPIINYSPSSSDPDIATTTTSPAAAAVAGGPNGISGVEAPPPPPPSSSSSWSPWSQLLERVYEQYPPLRPQQQQQQQQPGGNSYNPTTIPTAAVGLGEYDFRQWYHPMLSSTVSLSSPTINGDNNDDSEKKKMTMMNGNDDTLDGSSTRSNDDDRNKNINNNNMNVLSGEMDLIFVGTASCTPSVTRGVSCTALRLNRMNNSGGKVSKDGGTKIIMAKKNNKDDDDGKGNNNMEAGGRRRITTTTPPSSINTPLGTWLFDCGEATQLQIQRTSSVRPSKISKIFLTHSHGDHSFGLPGLLCLMGQDRGDRATSTPIDIYGPEGLRMWLRVSIRYSVSRIVPNYRVHELKDIPMAPEWEYSRRHGRAFFKGFRDQHQQQRQSPTWGMPNSNDQDYSSWTSQYHRMPLEASPLYGEVDGGRDIYPHYDHPLSAHGAPVWEVDSVGGEKNDDIRVYAAPMSHGIPCVGYAVHESNRQGRLRDEIVRPICLRNVEALKEAGFVHPMKAMAVIKNLAPGTAFTFPDGTVVRQEDAVDPPRRGRKIVICGDTASSRAMEGLAKDADVIVHEATNTFLYGLDKDTDLRSVTRDAIIHGHSTPYLAGEFCKRVGARRLILNHFSARYKGDPTIEAVSIMTRIEDQAIKASGLDRTDVAAAWDFMIYPIPASTETVQQMIETKTTTS